MKSTSNILTNLPACKYVDKMPAATSRTVTTSSISSFFLFLDSHTTTSNFTNIRIDNYVYTREALQRARQLLRPDGLFIVKFRVDTPWIAGRLYKLLHDTFSQDPIQFQTASAAYDSSGRFFVSGSQERLTKATAEPALAAYLASHCNMTMEPPAHYG